MEKRSGDSMSLGGSIVHSMGKTTALHLLPGIPVAVGMIIAGYLLHTNGFDIPTYALIFAVALVEIPLCSAIIYFETKKETGGKFSFNSAFPWRAKVPVKRALLLVPLVVIWSIATNGALNAAIQGPIINSFFSWVPSWMIIDFSPEGFSNLAVLGRTGVIIYGILSIVFLSLLGSIIQELYFRGFLLPRMPDKGNLTPVLNAVYFSLFHWTSPWQNPGRILMGLVWSYASYKHKSMYYGLMFHLGMAALGMVIMLFMIFSQI